MHVHGINPHSVSLVVAFSFY